MILSDKGIKQCIERGELLIDPFHLSQIQSASIDLRLGTHFMKVDSNKLTHLTLDKPAQYIEMESEEMIIPPRTFLLAATMEMVQISNKYTAFVEGRSSIGRLGLFIQNAGWIDPGFYGQLTLELFNANHVPIKLEAGRRVCQLIIAELDQESTPYNGKYNGQMKAMESQIHLDQEVLLSRHYHEEISKIKLFD